MEKSRICLSVLIPVKNEAENLRDCLASVSFADEIVLVDSASTDATAEIAATFGARVVQFDWNGRFPRKKNWALENIPWRHEWILIIDADERITPALQEEISRAVQQNDFDGYYINRRFWFLDGWINHCGYFPSWNLRLFRHRLGRYERIDVDTGGRSGDNEVHEHVLLKGRTDYLSEPMEHFAYPTIERFVDKHNRYARWEAAVNERLISPGKETLRASALGSGLERKRWLKRIASHLPFKPTLRFLYHYVLRQGFRDGYRGWILCRLLGWYELMIAANVRELSIDKGER